MGGRQGLLGLQTAEDVRLKDERKAGKESQSEGDSPDSLDSSIGTEGNSPVESQTHP